MHYVTETIIASSECAKLKHARLAKCVIIADHVTFMQPIRWRVVAESFPTFVHSRELLCELLEKAIVRRVIVSKKADITLRAVL